MNVTSNRVVVLTLLAISIALLIPGLLAPVLSIRGVLTRDGVAHVAPLMLEKGLDDDTMAALTGMLNPTIVGMVQAMGGDLRKMIVDKLSPQLTASLQKSVEEVEVYAQTRSILGSVQNLYGVGSPIPPRSSCQQRVLRARQPQCRPRLADWFAAYCLFALASQQAPDAGPPLRCRMIG